MSAQKIEDVTLSTLPSTESLEEIVKDMKAEKARWNRGAWIHKPDSWQNQAINVLEKEIQSRRDFEASQLKELEHRRINDTRSLAVRRALIDYIEKKVLGITRNALGEEITKK